MQMIRKVMGLCCAALVMAGATFGGEVLVKEGESIAFLGDSITQQGAGPATGYVQLVISGLKANGISAKMIPAGIGGNKSNDMLGRLQRDVLDKKPNIMTLSCGVNDVWHQDRNQGVLIDQYKENITAIVDKAMAAGVKPVILTATMITENPDEARNKKLEPYNAFLRELAEQKKLPLADLNVAMWAKLKELNPEKKVQGNLLTVDGVHMNPLGNMVMALGVLQVLGLDDAQLAKAAEAWKNGASGNFGVGVQLTQGQFIELQKVASAQNLSVERLFQRAINNVMEESLKKK